MKLKSCPHCGGVNGYYFRRTETYTVNGSWFDDAWFGDENAEYDSVARQTKPRCADCGKMVRIEEGKTNG